MEWWLVFITDVNAGNVEYPRHPKVRKCVWCNFSPSPFSSYPSSTDFHNTWVAGSGHHIFGSIQRSNEFSCHLCVELRQITTIFFFQPWQMVIAITWGEARDLFSTRFHNLNLKSFITLHENKWPDSASRSTLHGERIRFPWWNGSLRCLDCFFPL